MATLCQTARSVALISKGPTPLAAKAATMVAAGRSGPKAQLAQQCRLALLKFFESLTLSPERKAVG